MAYKKDKTQTVDLKVTCNERCVERLTRKASKNVGIESNVSGHVNSRSKEYNDVTWVGKGNRNKTMQRQQ